VTKLPPKVGRLLDPVQVRPLDTGWSFARTDAGSCASPADLEGKPLQWHEASVPGTVAGCLHRDLDVPGDYDAHDWWYATSFDRPATGSRHFLRFEGLATLAEVWLNGEMILASRNMFVPQRVDVTSLLADRNELAIAFRSLDAELARRRPRPRWKTRLVEKQALRWIRTTILGRIPAWTPGAPAVGPWGPVTLESAASIDLPEVRLRTRVEGGRGIATISARAEAMPGQPIAAAHLRVGEASARLSVDGDRIAGEVSIDNVPLWWPHTHGTPGLLPCRLELDLDAGRLAIDLGEIGFRDVRLDTHEGAVRFQVNGVQVFCRGAAWTPLDILRLRASPGELRAALEQLRDAGANMVRVGGTMAYESEAFYALCDELGILVWQDFMFANMDYPVGDAQFRGEVEAEARHQVTRLAAHPSVVAWCGGSEVAQQAAMQGLGREAWGGELFEQLLPGVVAELHPGTPYFPSSPWGGALPFHSGSGVAHYYGVGAYRRPIADAKAARVKFAAECLGFSNIPDDAPEYPPHHPRWKARVPRDSGSSYDFEDVRDHYLRELFGRDPVELRASDLQRYLAQSRVTSGEVMARVYSQWRASGSGCGGALVWFHRDLWAGAGWGIVAVDGSPKSPYWYLKRAWAPVAVRLTDEGLDGYAAHVINERARALHARLEVTCFLDGLPTGDKVEAPVVVEARETASLALDALLGHFTDATHAYRFGPPKQDAVVVRLVDATTGDVLSEDVAYPTGLDLPRLAGVKVESRVRRLPDGTIEARIEADRLLHAVSIECAGYRPDDNYFHVAPGAAKRVLFRAIGPARPFAAHLSPLNAAAFSLRAPGALANAA
jgi:beta-mannosidase